MHQPGIKLQNIPAAHAAQLEKKKKKKERKAQANNVQKI